MKFLLDENVHRGLLFFLQQAGHDAKVCPNGIRDRVVFLLARGEQRILITRDADFCSSPYLFQHHYGIVLVRVSPQDLEIQKKILGQLLEKFSATGALEGKVVKLMFDSFVVV